MELLRFISKAIKLLLTGFVGQSKTVLPLAFSTLTSHIDLSPSSPFLFLPILFTKGEGGRLEPIPTAISETVSPMNVKFCRVLETPLKVSEMLKLFT